MATSILCLDLGTSTGWALASAAALAAWPDPVPGAKGPFDGVESGVVNFNQIPSKKIVAFETFVERKIERYGVGVLVFETPIPHHKSIQASRISWGMAAVVEVVGARFKIKVMEKANSAIKKHFTGSGKAKKDDIIYRCAQRGWNPQSHDEADALALLDLTCSLFKQARDKEMA